MDQFILINIHCYIIYRNYKENTNTVLNSKSMEKREKCKQLKNNKSNEI